MTTSGFTAIALAFLRLGMFGVAACAQDAAGSEVAVLPAPVERPALSMDISSAPEEPAIVAEFAELHALLDLVPETFGDLRKFNAPDPASVLELVGVSHECDWPRSVILLSRTGHGA